MAEIESAVEARSAKALTAREGYRRVIHYDFIISGNERYPVEGCDKQHEASSNQEEPYGYEPEFTLPSVWNDSPLGSVLSRPLTS